MTWPRVLGIVVPPPVFFGVFQASAALPVWAPLIFRLGSIQASLCFSIVTYVTTRLLTVVVPIRQKYTMVSLCLAPILQQALFGFNPGVTVLIEFDHIDKRPTKPATPGDRRASEALPIFEGSEVHFGVHVPTCFIGAAPFSFLVCFHIYSISLGGSVRPCLGCVVPEHRASSMKQGQVKHSLTGKLGHCQRFGGAIGFHQLVYSMSFSV